jgi:hypothetical protein
LLSFMQQITFFLDVRPLHPVFLCFIRTHPLC